MTYVEARPYTEPFDAAILTSNDIIPEDLITENKPNGALFGLGFGGVFGMMDFFEGGKPEEIWLFDVDPEPVEVGNIAIDVMAKKHSFQGFLGAMIDKTQNPVVKRAADAFISGSNDPITFGLHHVNRNYGKLHALAAEGRINISFADIFNPWTASVINELKNPGKRNLLYVTDAPQFGLDRMDVVESALGDTWFVDTTTPYNPEKGIDVTTVRATYAKLPVYDDAYRARLR